jgi:hypothetical protein
MDRLKLGAGTIVTSLLLCGALGFGCATQGSGGASTADSGADASAEAATVTDTAVADSTAQDSARDSTVPPPRDSGSDSADAGDAAVDAPPDVLEEVGSPCPMAGSTQTRACGICGTQTSTCKGGAWGPFGSCSGELEGGCMPDATVMESCGFCGTRMRVCASDCEYAVSACTGQVPDACVPGAVDFEPDPTCDDAGILGKARICGSTCTLGPESACEAPPASLVIASSPMAVVDTIVDFSAMKEIPSLQTLLGCPQAIDDAGDNPDTPYGYVAVSNPTAQTAVVSIWTSKTPAGPTIDTMITSYVGSVIPMTVAARDNCTGTVTDSCGDISDPTSCHPGWGGLMQSDGNAVTLGPGASVIVYVAASPMSTPSVGPIRLSARTESLN